MTPRDWIALVQALAYTVLAIVAVITLKRASATLLQPYRTETFKVQLSELRALLARLSLRDELELRDAFGFGDLVKANAIRLHDRFIRDVYGIEPNESERPYSKSLCSTTIVADGYLVANHEGDRHPFRGQKVMVVSPKPGPSQDARAWWRDYWPSSVCVPTKQHEAVTELELMATSPLLPKAVVDEISHLLDAIQSNRSLMFEVLSQAGRELSERYPSPSPPETFAVDWVVDKYYAQFVALAPRVAGVTKAVRDHLATDLLHKPWKS